jgi:acyl-CoA oxidase
MSVLDYPTVQIRILPLLATTFALHYTGLAMRSVYQSTREDVEQGDFRSLAHMHSMSSGLKSLCTMLAADGIETCRRAMGGHGFGGGSGLIQLNNDYLSKPTVEGDNWMITQQVAAYLIKKMSAAAKSPNTPGADKIETGFKDFIRSKQDTRLRQVDCDILNRDQDIVKSFELRATALVSPDLTLKCCRAYTNGKLQAYDAYEQRVLKKQSWNRLLIQLHKLSKGKIDFCMID